MLSMMPMLLTTSKAQGWGVQTQDSLTVHLKHPLLEVGQVRKLGLRLCQARPGLACLHLHQNSSMVKVACLAESWRPTAELAEYPADVFQQHAPSHVIDVAFVLSIFASSSDVLPDLSCSASRNSTSSIIVLHVSMLLYGKSKFVLSCLSFVTAHASW